MRQYDQYEQQAMAFSERHIHACCCGGAGYVRCNAPPGHALFGKPIPCVCRRDARARERAVRLRHASGLSDIELSHTFEGFSVGQVVTAPEQNRLAAVGMMRTIKRLCQQFAANPQGWLVLRGGVGTGKTHLAYAVLAAVLGCGRAAFGQSVPTMLDMLRRRYEVGDFDEWWQWLVDVDVLVLDDLGAQRDTDWTVERLYQLIAHRYERRLPLLITTNLELESLDQRIASRIGDGSKVGDGWCRVLSMPCGDYRPTHHMAVPQGVGAVPQGVGAA